MTSARSKLPAKRLLTETELELMNILWSLQEATVNDVMKALPSERRLAYTSVSTILRILEQKEAVGSRKEGRGHVYFPRILKPDYEVFSVNNLVNKVFGGEPAAVVRRLLDTADLSEEELKDLKKLLNERLR